MKTDKTLHFTIGTGIAFVMINTFQNIINPLWVFLALTLLYFLFEVYQKVFKKGVFDMWDWAYGTLGAALIYLTYFISSW